MPSWAGAFTAPAPFSVDGPRSVPHTIYFNHGFSIINAISLIKRAAGDDISILASRRDGGGLAPAVADRAITETTIDPTAEPTAFADAMLETCLSHDVNLFIPGRGLHAIAAASQRFAANGICLLIAGSAATIETLDDKALFTRASISHGLPVAATHEVRSAAEFHNAVNAISSQGLQVCVKPPIGVFGAGYWLLSDTNPCSPRSWIRVPAGSILALSLKRWKRPKNPSDFSFANISRAPSGASTLSANTASC